MKTRLASFRLGTIVTVCTAALFLGACDREKGSDVTQVSPNARQVNGTADTPLVIKDQSEAQSEDLAPQSQHMFEAARLSKLSEYDDAINEIQKLVIFNRANSDLNEVLSNQGPDFSDWVGIIDSITTSHAGKYAHVRIGSLDGVIYDMQDDASAGSKIHQQLSLLQKYQLVKFSGKLNKSSETTEKWETSLIERDSLEKPEFSVSFESIEPYDNGVPESSSSRTVAQRSGLSSRPKRAVSLSAVQPLMEQCGVLNDKCRDGKGGEPNSDRVCEARERIYQQIKEKGWCWGHKDDAGSERDWVVCEDGD